MVSRAWSGDGDARSPPHGADPAPRYTAREIGALVGRRWPSMLAVFLATLAIGLLVALSLKPSYVAHASLLVRLGQEYVYTPQVGDAGRGSAPDSDQVVQSELEILQSAAVRRRVVEDVGLSRLFPRPGGRGPAAEAAAIRALASGLKAQTAPDNAVVRLSYAAPDPRMAALVLNTWVDEYLRGRRGVLAGQDAAGLSQQEAAAQAQLRTVDGAYQAFLTAHGVGDFDTERTALAALYAQLLTDSYGAAAQLSEAEGRLGATAREAAAAPAEVSLYRDTDHAAQDKLLQLRVDRQDLLSRYRPGSQPLQDMDRRIAAAEALTGAASANGSAARRYGANPVYQALAQDKAQLMAQAAALRSRKGALQAQIAEVTRRRQELAALEPQYRDLARQRDLLTASVRALSQRLQDSRTADALARGGGDAIRVVERAYPPAAATSLRAPVLALTLASAAFAAACQGLVGAFLSPGHRAATTAERAFGLPVLASIPLRG